jgi:Na(+)-translocating NADH:ubiquinone oxidoreductase A subunit
MGIDSMMLRNRGFSGGYRFRAFQGAPVNVITYSKIPQKSIILLQHGFGRAVPPLVKSGERVKAGQIIGTDEDSVSTPVHATVNGVVEEIKELEYFGKTIQAVTVKSDGTEEWQPLKGGSADWTKFSAEAVEERLYLSGVTSLGKSGIPTRFKSSVISPREVEHFIIHGIGSEVYNVSLSPLLEGELLECFINGLKILKVCMPEAVFHVAINSDQRSLIKQLQALSADLDWIGIYVLEPKYPQENDEVLIPSLLNREYPHGYLSANIGVIVLDIQAVLHVYDAVAHGKPLIERYLALCGPRFTQNSYHKVRVGTSINDIVDGRLRGVEETRLIVDNPMTGSTVTDPSLPIDRSCSGIIAIDEQDHGEFAGFAMPGFTKDSYTRTFAANFMPVKRKISTNVHGDERPCVFCGFCEDVCPVGIIPHLIYRNVERDNIDEILVQYRIFNCIDCNLCSYVCPSKIRVAAYIKGGKNKLIEMKLDGAALLPPGMELKGLDELKRLAK